MTASAVHEIEPCAYGKYWGGAYGRISPPMLGEGILYRKRRRRETGHLKNSLCNTSWYYWRRGGGANWLYCFHLHVCSGGGRGGGGGGGD